MFNSFHICFGRMKLAWYENKLHGEYIFYIHNWLLTLYMKIGMKDSFILVDEA